MRPYVNAVVDPANATSIDITLYRRTRDGDNEAVTLPFNVTHTYYRDLLMSRDNDESPYALKYDPRARRCIRVRRAPESSSKDNRDFFGYESTPFTFNYWINPYELPERIALYNTRGQLIRNLTDNAREKVNVIAILTKQVFDEMNIPSKRVNDLIDYYETMDLLYYPQRETPQTIRSSSDSSSSAPVYSYDQRTRTYRVVRTALKKGEFLPIQVHFRSAPYPQSTFMEFVSDRNRVWRVYDKRYYDKYGNVDDKSDDNDDNTNGDETRRSVNRNDETRPGNNDDLLYRLRHNLRHSLGLGHTTSKACVMYPTNVLDLNRPCEHENLAIHRLLCDSNLRIIESPATIQ